MKTIKDIENIIKETIKGTQWENLVYAAGGYVRDEIMGKEPHDLDLLIDKPNGGVEFADWIVNAVKIGKDACLFPRFGTAKFSIEGFDIEAVMPRGENYTEGSRKPEVFNVTLTEDAIRRDLTINSLFKNITTGQILDVTGKGLDDIRNRIIRTPIDSDITFKDDPLRMLRCLRLSFRLQFDIQYHTYVAIYKNAIELKNISNERIRDELDKILMLDNIGISLAIMNHCNILSVIIPELEQCKNVKQNHHHCDDVFYHTLEVVKNTKPVLKQRLMALFHDIAKPQCKTDDETGIHFKKHEDESADVAEQIMIRLKYPNDIIKSVKLGIANHMRLKAATDSGLEISDKALRKFKFDMGEDLEDVLDLIHADNISHAEKSCMPNQVDVIRNRIKNLNIIVSKPKLPVDGNDLIQLFNLKPGKIFKELLQLVEDEYLENPEITKEEAIKIIRNKLEETK